MRNAVKQAMLKSKIGGIQRELACLDTLRDLSRLGVAWQQEEHDLVADREDQLRRDLLWLRQTFGEQYC